MLSKLSRLIKGDYRSFLLRELPRGSVGCEVGVWKGDFSREISRIVKPRRLYLVDPWLFQPDYPGTWYGGSIAKSQRDMDAIHESVVQRFVNDKNVCVISMKTEDLSDEIPDEHLDWVYIDGNHEYDHVLRDLETYFTKVKRNGIICGDDYDRNKENNYPITRAVSEFLKAGTCELLWTKKNQFFLRKMGSVL